MTWISLSVFVLLTIGIVAICDIRFTALFERLVKSHGGSTLAEDLEVMSGNTPTGFFKRESYEVEQILKATGRENKFESIKTFSIIGFAVGCLLALLMGNGFHHALPQNIRDIGTLGMLAGDLYVSVFIHSVVQHIVPEQRAGDGLALDEILAFDDLHDLSGTIVQLLGVYNDRECFYHDLQENFVRHLKFSLRQCHHSLIG